MPDGDIDALRTAILKALQSAPDGQMLGAALGNRLRPTLAGRSLRDLGARNLSDFAKTHLEGEILQDAGASDITFRLKDPAALPSPSAAAAVPDASKPAASLTAHEDLFRIWKSPRTLYRLAVNRNNGSVRAIGPHAAPHDTEVVLTPPASEEHEAIARRFVEEHVPESARKHFLSQIDERNPAWWIAWDALFAEHMTAGRSAWLRFRAAQLIAALDRSLVEAGVEDEQRTTAHREVQQSRTSPRPRAPTVVPPASTAVVAQSDASLRSAAHAVIERMSDEELRRLWLPFGLVADALGFRSQ